MTLCPAYESAYKDELLQDKYGTDKFRYGEQGNYTTPKVPKADPKMVFKEVSHTLSDLLMSITLNLNREEKSKLELKYFMAVDFDAKDEFGNSWSVKYHSLYGRCYSLDLNQGVTRMGINAIEFLTKMDAYIFLHHKGQYLDNDSMTKVFVFLTYWSNF